jgi:hypothetical protein
MDEQASTIKNEGTMMIMMIIIITSQSSIRYCVARAFKKTSLTKNKTTKFLWSTDGNRDAVRHEYRDIISLNFLTESYKSISEYTADCSGRSLAGIACSIPVGGMSFCIL